MNSLRCAAVILGVFMACVQVNAVESNEAAAEYASAQPSPQQQTEDEPSGAPLDDGGLTVEPPDTDLCCDACDTSGPHITCTGCKVIANDILPPSMQEDCRKVVLKCPDDRPQVWDGDKFTCGS